MSVSINVFCFWHWWGIRYRQLLFSKCTYLYNLYWDLESLNWWTISNACSCLFKKCAEIALIFEIFEYSQYIVYLLFLFITWLNICKHQGILSPFFLVEQQSQVKTSQYMMLDCSFGHFHGVSSNAMKNIWSNIIF